MLTKGSSVWKQVRSVCPFDSLEEGAVKATWTRQSTSSGSACSISRNKLLHQRSFAGTRWVWLKMWLISINFYYILQSRQFSWWNPWKFPDFLVNLPHLTIARSRSQKPSRSTEPARRRCCEAGSLLWVLVDHGWPIQKCIISYMHYVLYVCIYI